MKFQDLKIENFCSIKSMTVSLNDQGLVLILGENRDSEKSDSNGSGKSLILDALVWCLWGKTVREVKGDDVVSRTFKKNCKVSLTFSEGDKNFEVSRYQKHKEHKKEFRRENDLTLACDGEEITGSSISDTQETLNNILGFDKDTFCALMPGAGIQVASLTDKGIKELIEQLLQMTELSQAQKKARESLKSVDIETSLQREKLKSKETQILSTEALIERDQVQADEFDAVRAKQIEDSEKEKRAALEVVGEYKKELDDLNEKLKTTTAQLDTTVDLQLAKANDLYKRAKAEGVAKLDVLKKEINKVGFALENLSKQRKRFLNLGEGECNSCGSVITGDHINSRVHATESDILQLMIRQKTLVQQQEELEEEQAQTLDALGKGVEKARSLVKAQEEVRNRILLLEGKIEFADFAMSQEAQKVAKLDKTIKELRSSKNVFLERVTEGTAQLVQLRKELETISSALDSLEESKRDLEFWVDGFSPKGLRSYMLAQVTPIMNDKVESYSKALTGGDMVIRFNTITELKNGNIKEDFHIDVDLKNGAHSYKGLSQGEKARADLAIALTLGDLASLRADRHVPFRFLDEAFEKVDSSGLDAIVDLLHDQSSKYETIFVITHKSEIKDYFTKSLTVVKEKGVSALK